MILILWAVQGSNLLPQSRQDRALPSELTALKYKIFGRQLKNCLALIFIIKILAYLHLKTNLRASNFVAGPMLPNYSDLSSKLFLGTKPTKVEIVIPIRTEIIPAQDKANKILTLSPI